MAKDMTEGKPLKVILTFAIPILIGNIFQLMYHMVDTIIVGRILGEDALAAVGSIGPFMGLVSGLVIGLAQGFGVMVSQAYGAHEYKQLKHYIVVSFFLIIVISVGLIVITLSGMNQFLVWMNIPGNIFELTADYTRIVFVGIIASMAYNVAAAILRGIGDSKTPLYFLIFSSILNLLLDVWFIVGLSLSTAGAALATVISQGVSAVLCLFYMFYKYTLVRFSKEDFYLDGKSIGRLLSVGIPMALSYSITATGTVILQSAINSFGSCVVAAYTAAYRVTSVSSQMMAALGTSMSTYCAQNIGAHKMKRIFSGMKIAFYLTCLAAALASLIHIFCGRAIVGLFVNNPTEELYAYATEYLWINSWFMLPLALIYTYRNALQGMGEGFMPMFSGFIEMVSRYLATVLLVGPFGYIGLCFANPAAYTTAAIVLIITYACRKRRSYEENRDF